jgi:hypothetical protein
MIKEFLMPDWRKLIVYLLFTITFMTETLIIRTIYQKDYIVIFLSNVYDYFFSGMKDYVNFFAIAFLYYIFVLTMLYVLSCIVIKIVEKSQE